MRTRTAAAATVAAGVVVLGGALVEAAAFVLRRLDVPVLPPGSGPIRLLHLSDLHLAPWQRRKQAWVAGLAALEPDLTVVTGDFLGHREAVPLALEVLDGLLDRPGAFVLGSNDYVAPRLVNPFAYLTGPTTRDHRDWRDDRRLPTDDLVKGLEARGWVGLTNARASLTAGGAVLDLVGVDDPHHGLDRMPATAERVRGAAARLGIAHAPYRRVLDSMADDGADVVLAGHTHGGQVALPGYGALLTNCDLPTRYAKGLFGWESTAGARTWVHVSAGVGTAPTAPVRLFCRPEATLLTLR